MGLWILAAVVFFILAVWRRLLSWDGALLASLLGLWVIYVAGPLWLLPLLFFFLSSSLLGKFFPKKIDSDAKAGKARDAWQVLCNGGVYGVLVSFAHGPYQALILQAMVISMAISTSDTWSSELGMYFRGKTWDMLSWKPLKPGLSGGISWQGTLAGVAGALAIALLGGLLLQKQTDLLWLTTTTLLGVAGMLFDSLLGAALQARYVDPVTGFEFDFKAGKFRLSKGIEWMTNDLVNLLSNLGVTTLGIIFLWLLA